MSIFDREVAHILSVRYLLKRVLAAEALNGQTRLNSSFEACKYSTFALKKNVFLSLRTNFNVPLKERNTCEIFACCFLQGARTH